MLIEKAREAIRKIELAEGAPMLQDDFGLRTTIAWSKYKFGFDLDIDELRKAEAETTKDLLKRRAGEAYDQKESEYPVITGLYRFTQGSAANVRLDREALAGWASERFGQPIEIESFRSKQREEIRSLLVAHSAAQQPEATAVTEEARSRVEQLFRDAPSGQVAGLAIGSNGALDDLSHWLHERLRFELPPQELARL